MANWQFGFVIAPEEKILEKNKSYSGNLKIDDVEEIMSWEGYFLVESSLEEISKILKPTKSWTDSIRQYGSLEETCIELCYEGNILVELSVRLDLRSMTRDILESVVNFIKINKGIIVTRAGSLVKPVIDDVTKEIKRSDAYSYVKNPIEYLTSNQ